VKNSLKIKCCGPSGEMIKTGNLLKRMGSGYNAYIKRIGSKYRKNDKMAINPPYKRNG
jgi:hypothetical protein